MSADILAIVGSTSWPAPEHLLIARQVIEQVLLARRPQEIVSGGAVGIDQLAKAVGDSFEIPVRELLPRTRRWHPDGFRDRNVKIATRCTRLLCIRSASSRTYGSGWTADRARDLGKPVKWVIIGEGSNPTITVHTFPV